MNWRHFLLINVLGGLPYTFAAPNVRRADGPSSEPPILSHTTSLPHSSYTATPTTSGAERASSVGSGISTLGPAPGATSYPSDGKLHDLQPAPFTPAGGVGTNGTTPISNAKSDFDYESLALVLYQEYIELDLFHDGLARFSVAEFTAAGLTAEDRFLIEFMADQEAGHATMLTNILGDQAPRQCVYNYPYATVHEFIDFCQKLTRFGEAGVYGFLPHLDSREAAGLLTQTVTTEARQQMIFRQFEGLFPMPVWFEVGVPQSWTWTLLAPYISYCPANQTRLAWQNFPSLYIENQPNPYRVNGSSSVNETLADGVTLSWDAPGKGVGPNNSYITNTTAGSPSYVLWASQLNVTYSTLTTSGNSSYGTTIQPDLSTYAGDPALNGTIFIAITDTDLFVTPFNISSINPHIVAGPALYQAG
ncbi:hypothetical protein LV157_000510 [Aspergillus fumigatus]|nr:hypothetical protein LV157_000510 [Aspergillus fumigatus]